MRNLFVSLMVLGIFISGCSDGGEISTEESGTSETKKAEMPEQSVELVDKDQMDTTKEDENKLISKDDREFHTIGGDENGPFTKEEYKSQLEDLIKKGKLVLLKTIDYKSENLGSSGKMDIIQLEDGILGIQYNDDCSCFYETYESQEEAVNAFNLIAAKDTFLENEASEIVENFYKNIANRNYKEAYELIGVPWRNELSYESFSSGYANTQEIEFWIIEVNKDSDTQMTVLGGLRSTDKSDTSMTKSEFNVEYDIEKQNGQLVISQGRGTVLEAIETPLNEESWSFDRWDEATLEEKITKIARTWEGAGLNPRGNGVLVSVSMYIDDHREEFLKRGATIEETIELSYDSPELNQYNPQEKCEKELPDDWLC